MSLGNSNRQEVNILDDSIVNEIKQTQIKANTVNIINNYVTTNNITQLVTSIGPVEKPAVASVTQDKFKEKYLLELHKHIRTLIDLKKYDDALKKAEMYISTEGAKIHPKYSSVIANKGVALYNLKEDKKDALECFEKSMQLEKNNPVVYVNLAIHNSKIGQMNKALEILDECESISPNYVPAMNLRAMIIDSKDSKLGNAITILEKAISIDPKFWDGYANLALLEGKNGKYESAKTHIEEAIKHNPSCGEYHAIFATNLLKEFSDSLNSMETKGEIKFFETSLLENSNKKDIIPMVIKEYEKANELGVEDKNTLVSNLSTAYLLNNQPHSAIELLKDVIEGGDCPLSNKITMAQAYSQIEDWDNSLKYYGIVDKELPDTVSILNDIGMIYMKKKDYVKSIGYLRKALDLERNEYALGELYNNLGFVHLLNATHNEAIKCLRKAYDLGRKDKGLILGLARSYYAQKYYSTAKKYYEEFLKGSKDEQKLKEYSQVFGEYADSLISAGGDSYPEAIENYKKAIHFNNSNIRCWENLMITQYNNGQTNEALETAETILGMNIPEETKSRVRKIKEYYENKSSPIIKPKNGFLIRMLKRKK